MDSVVTCCCAQCCSAVIDVSTPATLRRDFHNWLHSPAEFLKAESSDEATSPPLFTDCQPPKPHDGRKKQRKGTNLYGRPYCPGRPLSMEDRTRIIELHRSGMKVNAISKALFRQTGILSPASSPDQRRSRRKKSDSISGDATTPPAQLFFEDGGVEYTTMTLSTSTSTTSSLHEYPPTQLDPYYQLQHDGLLLGRDFPLLL